MRREGKGRVNALFRIKGRFNTFLRNLAETRAENVCAICDTAEPMKEGRGINREPSVTNEGNEATGRCFTQSVSILALPC